MVLAGRFVGLSSFLSLLLSLLHYISVLIAPENVHDRHLFQFLEILFDTYQLFLNRLLSTLCLLLDQSQLAYILLVLQSDTTILIHYDFFLLLGSFTESITPQAAGYYTLLGRINPNAKGASLACQPNPAGAPPRSKARPV